MTRRRAEDILIGFELGTGEPVRVPLAHTFVTGQTQLSGKTTTLQALALRSGKRSLAFVTKRGESFEGSRIRPYLPREGKEPIHWRFVESILASALGQRAMKYERYWIVNAAKGARSLEHVRTNVDRLMAKAKGSTRETYELIGAYLDLVLPEMRKLGASPTLELRAGGVGVMDLTGTSQQLQELVINAALTRIHAHESGVLTIFPEAWKFAPRNRVTPSSAAAQLIAREGAVIGNFLLCDSQDIAGVDTVIRQAASVWILGVQRELNELARTLKMIPAGIKKPKASDVTSLTLGQMIVCEGAAARRTYIWPAWMTQDDARAIATGRKSIDDVYARVVRLHEPEDRRDHALLTMNRGAYERAQDEIDQRDERGTETQTITLEDEPMSAKDVEEIQRTIREEIGVPILQLVDQLSRLPAVTAPAQLNHAGGDRINGGDVAQVAGVGAEPSNGADEPAVMTLKSKAPELIVEVEKRQLAEDENSARGRVAHLIAEGFFQKPVIGNEAYKWWKLHGFNQPSTRIYEALSSLVKDGFLIMGMGKTYQQHPNLKVIKRGEKTVTLTINYK